MTHDQILTRARSAVGKGIKYGLGKGGYWPRDPVPCRKSFKRVGILPVRALWCDCSGFIAWVLGRPRAAGKDWPWWLSTDSVWSDATGKQILFERLAAPVPGCIAVYPDWRDGLGKKHEGHIAIVANVEARTVVDCASSTGGVTEHPAPYFWVGKRPTVWCRYKGGLLPPPPA